jgi:hypothetical protein
MRRDGSTLQPSMSERPDRKPRPARWSENVPSRDSGDEGAAGRGSGRASSGRPQSGVARRARDRSGGNNKGKPTPARDLAGVEPRAPGPDPDLADAVVEDEEGTWRVRVLGRSGRAGGRAPFLLLLGFWDADEPEGDPSREAIVIAKTLSELTPERLEAALAAASAPPAREHRKPFFDMSGQSRRGASAPREP